MHKNGKWAQLYCAFLSETSSLFDINSSTDNSFFLKTIVILVKNNFFPKEIDLQDSD